jgi:hypothetical protein
MGEISITVSVFDDYSGKREVSSYEVTESYNGNPRFIPQTVEEIMARAMPLASKSAAVVFGDVRDTSKQ